MNLDNIWEDIETCNIHTSEQERVPTCARCLRENDARGKVIEALQAEAQTLAGGLSKHGVSMPVEVMLQIKMDLIVECLFGDARSRMMFEGEYGRRIIVSMTEAAAVASRQSLAPRQADLTVVRNGKRPHRGP